jgi:hypothetical protein
MVISWRAYARDRSRVRLGLHYHPQSGRGTSFRLRVVNHGRRLCYVERAEVLFRAGGPLTETYDPPRALSEAEPLDIWFPLFDKPLSSDIPVGLTGARLTDTLGKTYVTPRRTPSEMLRFFRLKRFVREEWRKYMEA